jgi:hypothetical protein
VSSSWYLAAACCACLVAASGCCEENQPVVAPVPVVKSGACLDGERIEMTAAVPGDVDSVSGRAGAAAGLAEVSVFEDALLQKLIVKGAVAADGSFGPVRVGDNAHAVVWVVGGAATCDPVELANDIEATTTELIRTPPAIVESGDASMIFECGQPPCTFQCQIDQAKAAACESPYSITGLTPGRHELRIQAIDAAGNVELIPTEFSFEWAVGTPEVRWTKTPAAKSGPKASFDFACDKSECVFECQLDDAPYTPCTSPHALTGLAVGPHSFRVRTHGDAAAAQAKPATFTWTVAKTNRGEP